MGSSSAEPIALSPNTCVAKLDEVIPEGWPPHWTLPYEQLPLDAVLRIRWVNRARLRLGGVFTEIEVVAYSTTSTWDDLLLLPRSFFTTEHFQIVDKEL